MVAPFSGQAAHLIGSAFLSGVNFLRAECGHFWPVPPMRIPEHPAGHTVNIGSPKPGHPATFGASC